MSLLTTGHTFWPLKLDIEPTQLFNKSDVRRGFEIIGEVNSILTCPNLADPPWAHWALFFTLVVKYKHLHQNVDTFYFDNKKEKLCPPCPLWVTPRPTGVSAGPTF